MNIVRELPTIIEEYRSLRINFDYLCKVMNEKGYDETTKLEKIQNDKEIMELIDQINHSKKHAEDCVDLDLTTERGKKFAKTNFEKWSHDLESNPYANAKRNTIAEVFSAYFSALSIMKLEIGLCSITMTKGKVEDAKSLSKKAILAIPATSGQDTFIFNSATTMAKADGMKLDETKIK